MIEKLRFKCPCCGMVSDVDRLKRKWRIKVFIQRFGGKVTVGVGKHTVKGKGKAKGFMEYVDVTKSRPDIVGEIMEKIDEIRG